MDRQRCGFARSWYMGSQRWMWCLCHLMPVLGGRAAARSLLKVAAAILQQKPQGS